jgi:hypothetical protein
VARLIVSDAAVRDVEEVEEQPRAHALVNSIVFSPRTSNTQMLSSRLAFIGST